MSQQRIFQVEQEKKYDDEYHGRYLISEDQEWNITSLDTVGKAQRDDIHKIQNRETFNKDLKNFEDLWNDDSTFKIGRNHDDYNKILNLIKNYKM